jgi:hypothetical protein
VLEYPGTAGVDTAGGGMMEKVIIGNAELWHGVFKSPDSKRNRARQTLLGALMRTLTLNIPDDIYNYLEIRAAIDDLRISQAVEDFLIEFVTAKMEGRKIRVQETVHADETMLDM